MTLVKLQYVQAFMARGRRFHYFRKPGAKRVRLPGLPGSTEFMEAYQLALADAPAPIEIGESRTKPLIVAYYKSAEFLHVLSAKTQATRRGILERFRATRGDRPLKLLEPKHLAGILDAIGKPHVRRAWFKTIRGLMKYAVQIGMINVDPTRDIRPAPPRGSYRGIPRRPFTWNAGAAMSRIAAQHRPAPR
jgi:hypothetical protein